MDTIYKIVSIAIITCIACLIVKPIRSDFAIFISIVGGIIILFYTFSYISEVFNVSGASPTLYTVILKIMGIGYLAEFTASICNDTGNNGLADKVLLGGKIIILVMALPIISSILEIIMELLPR